MFSSPVSRRFEREKDNRELELRRRKRRLTTTTTTTTKIDYRSYFPSLIKSNHCNCYHLCHNHNRNHHHQNQKIVNKSILLTIIIIEILMQLTSISINGVWANTRTNLPPRFKSDNNDFDTQSEIVVRVKEGASSLNKEIYHLYGEDPDNDPLTFGVLGTLGKDLLRIESISKNEAKVYLKKELDREIQDSYTLVLTMTDGKLGKGNYVSIIFYK